VPDYQIFRNEPNGRLLATVFDVKDKHAALVKAFPGGIYINLTVTEIGEK
jgi:hypothetical protein